MTIGGPPIPDPERPLVCPNCQSPELRSDEVAAIGYPVRLSRATDGGVEVDYTGGDRTVFDEGTVYSGDLWCLACGHHFGEDDLAEPDDDEE